jgi:hypothetical protein
MVEHLIVDAPTLKVRGEVDNHRFVECEAIHEPDREPRKTAIAVHIVGVPTCEATVQISMNTLIETKP